MLLAMDGLSSKDTRRGVGSRPAAP
ncbi:hypothetical protein PSCLAVI8L_130146 [Pseudoclavibacter sp. 8L]|nr:hypothetical protein PSCLAVI8L_130146 [Pseudoclavibacter sp. 8L]